MTKDQPFFIKEDKCGEEKVEEKKDVRFFYNQWSKFFFFFFE